MKAIELSETALKNFNLTLCEGKAVVRNQNRINGLIGVRNSLIPEVYHHILAKATFTGNVANEIVVWSTDVFRRHPVRLSELLGEEYEKYSKVLQSALQAYASAFKDAEDGVKKLVYAAITYASEDSVYCADDRVVITEWGMSKKGKSTPIGMPLSIDDVVFDKMPLSESDESFFHNENASECSINNTEDDGAVHLEQGENMETQQAVSKDSLLVDDDNKESVKSDSSVSFLNGQQHVDTEFVESKNDSEKTKDDENIGKKNKWWRWFGGLLLVLLVLLTCIISKGCQSSSVIPVSPEIDSTQVELSKDSLRYVVNNRLLILITNDKMTIENFVESFRDKYVDEEKYVLSNPDTLIRRVTLTLPAEEKDEFEEKLPTEFADFGLVVIPETMYKGSYQSNDPGMSDANKRWYFDECSIFDAWDVTMGSEDVVVAVIDDGFDLNHSELEGKIIKPFNAVYHSTVITPSSSGHGTHVAATAIGNADNHAGISGVAPKCKLMPIQVGDAQGNMTMSAIMDAVVYAIGNGADVVNMSLGMYFGPFVQFAPLHIQRNFRANMFLQEERVWNHLFEVARRKNVTFVLAGGNENCLIGLDPMQRSQNTIKVSAVQPDKQKASFSNYGDMSTVSAPGVRIFNAVPNNRYTYMDGTSMAAPIVTGGCALLKSNNPSLTVAELARILRETGNPSLSNVGPIVNFAKALDVEYCDVDECLKINERYNELLAELEELKRKYPECIQQPDTFALPEDVTITQLLGRWKSTTSLYNQQDEEVVIYFTFNGTSNARLDIVEPNGDDYMANLDVSISNDQVLIEQTAPAINPSSGRKYNPYTFVLKPNPDRKAEGHAKNKVEAANMFNFKLIKI